MCVCVSIYVGVSVFRDHISGTTRPDQQFLQLPMAVQAPPFLLVFDTVINFSCCG